ncbi:MAG TPA: nucleotidyltransferase family protein [Anaerolineaceae bacterium]
MSLIDLPSIRLLSLAARARGIPEQYEKLSGAVAGFQHWQDLPVIAEAQRMAPLFYTHSKAAGIKLPEETRLQFQGVVLRHQSANWTRLQSLTEILKACADQRQDVVLLKGAALAWTTYPKPGLRPMRDLDLLAPPGQVGQLERILCDLGYQQAKPDPEAPRSARHHKDWSRQVAGLQVTVEAHHSLFDPTWQVNEPDIDAWFQRSREVKLETATARTLSPEDMLWLTYQHMVNEEMRVIYFSDMISIAEQYANEIDWQRVRKTMPAILACLALLGGIVPIDCKLIQAANLPEVSTPVQVDADLQGWPRISLKQARSMGLPRSLIATLAPSEWWLRLYYGILPGCSIWRARYIDYPLDLVRRAWKHQQMHGK